MNKDLAKQLPNIPEGWMWRITRDDIYPIDLNVILLKPDGEEFGREDSKPEAKEIVRNAEKIMETKRIADTLLGDYPAEEVNT